MQNCSVPTSNSMQTSPNGTNWLCSFNLRLNYQLVSVIRSASVSIVGEWIIPLLGFYSLLNILRSFHIFCGASTISIFSRAQIPIHNVLDSAILRLWRQRHVGTFLCISHLRTRLTVSNRHQRKRNSDLTIQMTTITHTLLHQIWKR